MWLSKFVHHFKRAHVTPQDCVAMAQDGTVHVCKLLSEDPLNYPDAPREGIRRLLVGSWSPRFPEILLKRAIQL